MPPAPLSPRRAVLALALAALAVPATCVVAQEQESADSDSPANEVSLWIDARDRRGRSVAGELLAADVTARLGERPVEVVEVGDTALARRRDDPAAVTVWFDRRSADGGTLRRAAQALAGEARQLADLGEVAIVEADAEGAVEILASRDPFVLGEHLTRTTLTARGEHAVRALREAALAEVAALPAAAVAHRLVAAVEDEAAVLQDADDRLLAWAAERPPAPARLLFLVSEGYDLDPLVFWSGHLPEATLRDVVSRLVDLGGAGLDLEERAESTARALSALGFTVVAIAPEAPAAGRFRSGETVTRDPTGGEVDRTGGVTTSPGRLFGRGDDDAPPILMAPRRPLELLAAATGGEVATSAAAAREAVGRLGERHELRLRVAQPLDDQPVALDLGAGGDVTVTGRRWLAGEVPTAVAAARLRRLFAGAGGDALPVTAVLVSEAAGAEEVQGTLEVRLDRRGEPALAGELLLSTAVRGPDGEARIEHRRVGAGGPAAAAAAEEVIWELPLTVPADAQLAVLLSDPRDGRWGGALAGVRHAAPPRADESLPGADVVALELPPGEVLTGRVRVAARPLDRRVARVVFVLDDREVGEADAAPWRVRLDLGDVPRRRRLEVVAFDAAGEELGRDLALLNQGHGGFTVDIVRPREPRGTGAVEVEAEVAVPRDRRLDRVLFYWNNELVATLFAPPFRQRILIPEEKPVGYVRVVALLADGTLAEDVRVMNGPQAAERVDVRLVEIYAVVTDRDGRPVAGLEESDFRLREDGVPQEIATFRAAGDLPITLGLAIDSSASMFVKLPRVQEAVVRFLASAFGREDRGFVVDFDSQPRLARAMTQDRRRLEEAVAGLEAGGRTALWESVVYSLVQLQGVAGRKALIVFSDGADEDDQFPFGSAIDVARRMGVPVYLIFMRHEPEEGLGGLLGRSFASRVDRLVAATGGRVFYAKEYDDLGTVYDEIERELRSQYLIAYYPRSDRGDGWRNVDLEVTREGLVPRTLSGYYE